MSRPIDPEATPRDEPLIPSLPLTRPTAHDDDDADGEALAALCWADPLFVERYEGWEELGRGSGATVVRTYQRDLGQEVALKIAFRLTVRERRRFVTEAQALMRCLHPCVVRVLSTFNRGMLAWLEMELVDGVTLQSELARCRTTGERWPLCEALEVSACLAEGLAAVHAAGIVHRDVKPSNVLLPRRGHPAAKLTDFGIARALDATIVLGEGVPGSPKYLCPEALLPSERVGPAGDVYSLSLTLYQIFSGGLYPFVLRDGATVGEVLECHTRRSPLSLRTLGLGVPDDVVDLIHEGLHKNPARRPSAAAVAHLLREEQRRQRLGLPATRRRRLLLGRPLRFWLNALAWTALTAAGAWALWRG